ncbi:Rha family phage regulatory protein [Cytobacillus horneckiae]|uniref:phage antirepressor KilAC domain-containing protein n=1 Tax=Cytobacillus horneckiae TaxID=549687 RepID=UPI0019CF8DB0|nr:phage antirepressor KilAC domain-containing protein [Cytobacillus horneckiae]MBN6886997.1 phage antirepressor KilAC domain-containing protein [Cytobacillus horneckiae]
MNQLVFIDKGQAITDSLTIASMFGKRHDNVLRDIENQIELAGDEFSSLNFEESNYESRGKNFPKYNLTEEAFTLVVFSYNTKEAVQTKIKFIQEFKRMRETLRTISSPSYMIEDSIKRAEKWIEEQKEKRALEVKTLMLEQQVAEAKPKVTYYDEILKSTSILTITQIAKDYGMSGKALNDLLHEEGIQYKQSGQWLLYHKYQDKGYTKSDTQKYRRSNGETGTKLHTKWTQKGRLFIHNILSKKDIEPLMDRELDKKDA